MAALYTRADALREYLTGATADGGAQPDPSASLGHYRSSTEAVSLGLTIFNALSGVMPLYASGGNDPGPGILTAVDANHLTWQPSGAVAPGPPAAFSGAGDVEIVEAQAAPGQYLRIAGTPPFTPGVSTIVLAVLANNLFGFDDLSIAQAASGLNEYRASVVRNEGTSAVGNFQRWLALLGLPQPGNLTQLPASGAGALATNGSLATWPASGWCQIRSSGGTLREVVYYTARTNLGLVVPATGRGLLGTTPNAGASTDTLYPTPSVGLALDPTGVQAFGSPLQVLANANTPPSGVTWDLGLTAGTGLQIGTLAVAQQVGLWLWRQVPAGAVSTPQALTQLLDSFNAM